MKIPNRYTFEYVIINPETGQPADEYIYVSRPIKAYSELQAIWVFRRGMGKKLFTIVEDIKCEAGK